MQKILRYCAARRILQITSGACLALAVAGLSEPAWAQSALDRAWAVLREGLGSKHTEEHATAVRLLGLLPKESQAVGLAEKALGEEKPAVRAAAAAALAEMNSRDSIPKLKTMLQDKDVSVVMAAAQALVAFQDPAGYEVYYAVLTGERKGQGGLVEEQIKMLKDPKQLARFSFEEGIGYFPFAGGALEAIRTIRKHGSSPVRAAAAKVLVEDPDPRSATALVEATSDKSWTVRAAALEAIARRGDASLVPRIESKLADEKSAVRCTAAAAVLRLARPAEAGKR
jgi:HEAT repeat protein